MARTLPMVASDWALFLDVDGTLVHFVADPSTLMIPRALGQTLAELSSALAGALAIISGRSIADLDRLFSPLRFPLAGQHGAEMRRDGTVNILAPKPEALAAILAPVYAFAERHPAVRIEHKGMSVAVHYRGAEDAREPLRAILGEALARDGGDYELLQSHLAFDVRPRGAHKGFAVEWFMGATPFAGRVPIFIGDDRTDEDGFAAALARGGHAIKVGGGTSVAPWHLSGPDALWHWLERSKAALEGAPRS
ncbi:MAG TPA: trehalose-phosphatase [Stellaceae bacterium]|nr:trehalose-phosphatase [Stellaceae bacterium]